MGEEKGLIQNAEELLKASHMLHERLASLCDRLMGPQPDQPKLAASAPAGMRYGGIIGNLTSAVEVLAAAHNMVSALERAVGANPPNAVATRAERYA